MDTLSKISKREAKKQAKDLLWWLINYNQDNGILIGLISQKFTGEAADKVWDEVEAIKKRLDS